MASAQHYFRKATQIVDNLNVVGKPTAAQVLAVQIAQVYATLAAAAVQAEATAGRVVVLDPDGPSLRPYGAPS